MAEERLATEGLHVEVLDPLSADLLIRKALHVFEQVQAHHEAGRQPGPACLGVAGAEGVIEAGPIMTWDRRTSGCRVSMMASSRERNRSSPWGRGSLGRIRSPPLRAEENGTMNR